MTVKELLEWLKSNAESLLHIMLPSGEFVPAHFHVTEVGRIQKDFIDCGGTRRGAITCSVQVWTATDLEHRLSAGKLSGILTLAGSLLGLDALPVEIEYGAEVASHYFLSSVEPTPKGLLLVLVGKQTDCLAKGKCGVGEGCCQ
jgi:hypothetical protein